MRLIAMSTLAASWVRHPETRVSLERWAHIVGTASWTSTADVQASFTKAKVLDGERVRFEISGSDDRLAVAFAFRSQIAFVEFVGTYAEYDRVDAPTVSQFRGYRDGHQTNSNR